jgi:hypothetical protein
MIYVGIDPGLQGGIAVIDTDDMTSEVIKMPVGKNYPEPLLTVNLLGRLLLRDNFCVAIEQTQTRPGQGIAASHNYGIGFGVLVGALYAMKPVEFRMIRPQVWQKDIWGRYGAHGEDSKQRTYQAMLRAHPDRAADLTTIRGKLLDGNSDALGIATWIRDQHQRQPSVLYDLSELRTTG